MTEENNDKTSEKSDDSIPNQDQSLPINSNPHGPPNSFGGYKSHRRDGTPRAPKATKAQIAERMNLVRRLKLARFTDGEVRRIVSEEYNVSRNSVQKYITRVRKELLKESAENQELINPYLSYFSGQNLLFSSTNPPLCALVVTLLHSFLHSLQLWFVFIKPHPLSPNPGLPPHHHQHNG